MTFDRAPWYARYQIPYTRYLIAGSKPPVHVANHRPCCLLSILKLRIVVGLLMACFVVIIVYQVHRLGAIVILYFAHQLLGHLNL